MLSLHEKALRIRRASRVKLPQTVTACREFLSFPYRASSAWAERLSAVAADRRRVSCPCHPVSADDVSRSAVRARHCRHLLRLLQPSKHARLKVSTTVLSRAETRNC